MGWFSKSESRKTTVSQDLWVQCSSCKARIYKDDWHLNLSVCPRCNFHDKLTAYERIGATLDSGSFKEMFETIRPSDPLKFICGYGSYAEKVKKTRESTSLNESVVSGVGKIDGMPVSVSVMDFRFFGGSLGSGTGEKILRGANYAYEHKIPYLVFSASGGARMEEGILSLMQMAKTCAGVARLEERKLPYISVMTDPTFGGVSASFATVGDVNLAEPGARIGFAGRRVIETTIKQKLPDDFQTAEYLVEHGFVDSIVQRKDMKKTLALILSYYHR